MGCFGRCSNNRGNWNNCRCNDNNDWEERKRRAYWAGFRDGCNNPRCRWRNDNDNDNDDCGC